MAIDIYTEILSNDYQLANKWDFYFTDNPLIRFKVINAYVPFINLAVEKRSTGEHSYSGVNFLDEFSIDFRETTEFSTFNYFDIWRKQIFNYDKKTFKSYLKGAPQITKTGILKFYKYNFLKEFETKTFQLIDMRVLSIDPLTLTYDSNEILSFKVTFSCDDVL